MSELQAADVEKQDNEAFDSRAGEIKMWVSLL
jgi:hypothetical protein